jgi:hypothetical protein
MVRNVDLPEAIVFYGIESIMEPPSATTTANNKEGSIIHRQLRPGVKRLLEECNEVGTASLLLSEDSNDDNDNNQLDSIFREEAYCKSNIHVRCLSHNFSATPHTLLANNDYDSYNPNDHLDDDDDESLLFYNLQTNGRSPSPAFLLDSLNSVHINPRGFGGHSGFGRGQWTEPRRCPLPARTVVFIAGDWVSSPNREGEEEEEEETEQERIVNNKRSTLSRDRCSAARAAGCRVIYLEQQQQQQQPLLLDDPTTNSNQNQLVMIHDDESTMSLCDAVIDTFGNDNIRDLLQPISLDAISTPGNYWLNPPTPRDEFGNSVSVEDLVNKYRLERLLVHHSRASSCESLQEEEEEASENVNVGVMSEEEIDSILADLDGL